MRSQTKKNINIEPIINISKTFEEFVNEQDHEYHANAYDRRTKVFMPTEDHIESYEFQSDLKGMMYGR